MHAASVNPEPGSNSLKNCISKSSLRPTQTSSLELFYLSFFFYFVWVCFKVLLTRFLTLFSVFLRNFIVVQFSMIDLPYSGSSPRATAYILYYKHFTLSSGFLKVFSLFLYFCILPKKTRSKAALHIQNTHMTKEKKDAHPRKGGGRCHQLHSATRGPASSERKKSLPAMVGI